jgi:predicted alpha/beta-hydrolase family hydrolase
MQNLPTFQYYHNPKSNFLNVILQGSNVGVNSPFLQKIFATCREMGDTTVAFNFPYFDREEDTSSGKELKEEIETLRHILQFTEYERFDTVRLIGKSLGSIVSSRYLESLSSDEQTQFESIVLGYVTGEVALKKFTGKIVIIQGEKDKFGDIETVKKDLEGIISKDITYHQIAGADHSYRDPQTKEPLYENEVIEILKNL